MTTPTPDEIYRGYLRYEFARKLNTFQFAALFDHSTATGQSFDELVDNAMAVTERELRLPYIEKITTQLASTEDMENDRLYEQWKEQYRKDLDNHTTSPSAFPKD
jgi:hypothetical protein